MVTARWVHGPQHKAAALDLKPGGGEVAACRVHGPQHKAAALDLKPGQGEW